MFYNTRKMLLKTAIFIVIALILLSLVSSLFFLLKDQGTTESKRTVYGLGVRVSLGVLLIILITYGLYTGQLGNSVPWDQVN
jgi:flagellar biosynthesis protein FlhB